MIEDHQDLEMFAGARGLEAYTGLWGFSVEGGGLAQSFYTVYNLAEPCYCMYRLYIGLSDLVMDI